MLKSEKKEIHSQKAEGTKTLLLRFQRPFRGKKSSPLPTFSCQGASQKSMVNFIPDLNYRNTTHGLTDQNGTNKLDIYPWCWQNTPINLGKTITYRNPT